MPIIYVYDLIKKSSCILHSDGLILHKKLSEIKHNTSEDIVVDFKNLKFITFAFLNASIGKFIQEDNSVISRLKFKNTPDNIHLRLKKVIELASNNIVYNLKFY